MMELDLVNQISKFDILGLCDCSCGTYCNYCWLASFCCSISGCLLDQKLSGSGIRFILVGVAFLVSYGLYSASIPIILTAPPFDDTSVWELILYITSQLFTYQNLCLKCHSLSLILNISSTILGILALIYLIFAHGQRRFFLQKQMMSSSMPNIMTESSCMTCLL